MVRTSIHLSIALSTAVFVGCATQTTNEAAPAPAGKQATRTASSAPAPAPAPSSSITMGQGGRSSSGAMAGAKQPATRSVYYELDVSDLRAEDRRVVEAHARYLLQHPEAKVKIEGNADERGSSEYNLALGQRRAEGVARALRAGGVSSDRLEAVSYGKEKPIATGHDEKSWSQNRRSDMVYR
jgi:peptidoglycan-associated lipoprotein